MYRIIMVCSVLCSLLLALPMPAEAAPTITKDFAFIDNRPAGDIFGYTGLILNLDLIATDTGGSGALTGAGSSQTAFASNSSFPFTNPANMNLNAVFPIISGAEFTRFYSPLDTSQFSKVTGTYTFTVTNADPNNDTDTSTSHTLDKLEVIPIPTNLAFSDQSTTPVFTFTDPDSSPNISRVNRKYEFLIFDDTKTNIFESAILTTTTFTVPSGILQPGQTYYFRAQSMDFDPDDYVAGGPHSNLENRAIAYATFQAAVPEPTTMLLLGLGLVGLAGVKREIA